MNLSQTSDILPLSEARKQEIHRAARRAQAEVIYAGFRAIGAGVRAILAHKPARGTGGAHPAQA